ncbi:MAG: hypothetical protein ACK5P7_05465 [Bdellovibrio sp.]|jgi:hypothetical protein
MKSSPLFFLFSVIGFLVAPSLTVAAPFCGQVFRSIETQGPAKTAPDFTSVLRFDENGFVFARGAKGKDQEVQFGFESEYTAHELGPMTKFYGPDPVSSGISAQAWKATPIEGRLAWVLAKLKTIPYGAKETVLVRLDKDPSLAFLPETLIKDDTGNVEVILSPVSSFEVWKNQMQWINRNLGVGSMQAMISQPRGTFFPQADGPMATVIYKENKGFFNFVHESDALDRMARGAEKYQADPSKEVMRPFLHPYLGPMIEFRHKRMRKAMFEHAQGKDLEQATLEAIVRREQSFKYIGSTAYRPDIGAPTRISQEVRDAHKDEDVLIERVKRSMVYMQEGRSHFLRAADIKPFDSEVQFNNLTPQVQNFLKTVFPHKAPARVQEFENALFVHETYRNFAYPLHQFRPWLAFMNRMDLVKTVEQAQNRYREKLESLAEQLEAGSVTKEDASRLAQGALAQFAVESKLSDAFKNYEAEFLRKASRERSTTQTLDQPARALEARLILLTDRWQENVQMVSNVRFRHKDENQKNAADRRILVVSTHGLSGGQKENLKTDYLNLLIGGTVSFPLKERATHLLVRVNEMIYDLGFWPTPHFPRFRVKDYQLPRGPRLESVVLLSRVEESRLKQYIENVQESRSKVLGAFAYRGAPETRGTLTDNRSLGCGHNCTTWIATSPIGAKNESLLNLLNAEGAVPWIAQNPGWLTSWLTASAPSERVPFLVYWTDKPLAETLKSKVKENELLEWDFNKK